MINRRTFLSRSAQISALAACGLPRLASAQVASVPFSLDFRVYGGNSPFFLGNSSGIFEDAGFQAALEGASGSAESIRRVATGSHHFGYADIQTLINFTVSNPDTAPKLLMPILDRSPASIMTIGGDPISSLADLKGKKIGIAANSAATMIMPVVLGLNEIAEGEIEFTAVDVRIRDSMLLQGEVDGVVGFDYTSVFNFIENGVERGDINILYFEDFGFNFPGSGLIASQRMVAEEPELCEAMALGVVRAWRATYNDPGAAIDATVAHEPLLRNSVELERINFILETHVATDSVKENGIGHFDPARIEHGLELMTEGYGWDRTPEISEFFVDEFMPSTEERNILG